MVSHRCPGLNGIHKVLFPNLVRYRVTRCPRHPQWPSPKGLPRWETPSGGLYGCLLSVCDSSRSGVSTSPDVSLPPWSRELGKIVTWVPFYWWKQLRRHKVTQPVRTMERPGIQVFGVLVPYPSDENVPAAQLGPFSFSFLVKPHGMEDLNFPTRDRSHTLCTGDPESSSLDC